MCMTPQPEIRITALRRELRSRMCPKTGHALSVVHQNRTLKRRNRQKPIPFTSLCSTAPEHCPILPSRPGNGWEGSTEKENSTYSPAPPRGSRLVHVGISTVTYFEALDSARIKCGAGLSSRGMTEFVPTSFPAKRGESSSLNTSSNFHPRALSRARWPKDFIFSGGAVSILTIISDRDWEKDGKTP